jgi:hypothetical protein
MKMRIFPIIGFGLAAVGPLFAQLSIETMPAIPFHWGHGWGVAGRDLGMGGAMTAVGGDYTALRYNPAGLGLVERTELLGGLAYGSITNESNFLGVLNTANSNATKLGALGAAVSLPTARGSLVLGIGYHRVRAFDNELFNTKFIDTPGDSVTWSYRLLDEGGLSNTVLAGAVEMAPGVFFGGSMQFWGGDDDYTWNFQEIDSPYPGHPFGHWTFSRFDSTNHIFSRFSGVNFNLGALFKSRNVSLGAALETPLTLKSNEDWDYRDVMVYDSDMNLPDETNSASGVFEYKIRMPMVIRMGAAVQAGPILIAGDTEFVQYGKIRYRTEPSAEGLDMAAANLSIRDNLRNVMNLRVGGELALGRTGTTVRGGYATVKTPYKNVPSQKDRTVYSVGIGYALQDRIGLDVGYAWTDWQGFPNNLIAKETVKSSQVLVSFTYRM